MIQATAQAITLEEFLSLPETEPASEYFDGSMISKPMPQGKHSTLQRDLTLHVENALKPHKLGRAFPELRCTFAQRSIVPDVSVFEWSRIPRDSDGSVSNQFLIAPDWVIEILSPDQSQTMITKKIIFCLKNGTQMGWLVDPAEETIFIYEQDQSIQIFDRDNPQRQLPIPGFAKEVKLTLQKVMNWLLE